MNKETLTRMYHMKLYGMHLAFKSVVEENGAPGLNPDQLVGHLVDAEYDDRYNRKIGRLLKTARLRYKAAIEDLVFDPQRNMDRETIIRLAEGMYLDKAENVFITGSTGVGKS
jgi:DNA replication protein DnaC